MGMGAGQTPSPDADRAMKRTSTKTAARTKSTRAKIHVRANRASDPHSTRLALMRAAERLMAERGIDAVSLREVSAAAGQLNNSAVLYHFGSRDALIDAILERHSLPIHVRWASQLDFIDRQEGVELRPLVEMLVVEVANKLDDDDGGWEYLSICGQLLLTPYKPLVERAAGNTPTVQRLVGKMLPYYTVPPEILPLRFERLVSVLYTSLLGFRRAERSGTVPVSRQVFTSELVDAIVALVTQPFSPQTLALLPVSKGGDASPKRRER